MEPLAAEPSVVEAHYVTGEADVVLVLALADMAEYGGFVQRRLNDEPTVRRFKTLTAIRELA